MRHKFNAKPTVVDGIRFDSKAEAKRYTELKLMERGGAIQDLQLQPSFDLHSPDGTKITTYRADFSYVEYGERVIEDVKGVLTPVYRIKRKWMKAEHGIEIKEITK